MSGGQPWSRTVGQLHVGPCSKFVVNVCSAVFKYYYFLSFVYCWYGQPNLVTAGLFVSSMLLYALYTLPIIIVFIIVIIFLCHLCIAFLPLLLGICHI